MENTEYEIDLREIFVLLLRHIVSIIAFTVVGAIVAGLISIYAITPMYQSTAEIYILTAQDSIVSLSDLQVGSSLANDYEELIQSRPVVETVAENLDLDMEYEALLGCLSISNPTNTRAIKITITYSDPVLAKEIANEFSSVSRKQISQIMQVAEPTVVQEAVAAKNQSSPNNVKNIMIGALLGMILTMGFIIVRYLLDDTLKNPDDVEKFIGLNTLAAVPNEGGTDNHEKKDARKVRGIRKR